MNRFARVVAPARARPQCPAAALVSEADGGSGCQCGITLDLITSAENPSALARWCFNEHGYRTCPTWRQEKDAIAASRLLRPLLTPSGQLTAGHPEDRERQAGLDLAYEAQERDQWLSQPERA